MAKVTCENIPSRRDIHEMLDNFRQEHMTKDNIVYTKELSNTIMFNFEDSTLAIKFLQYVNAMKLKQSKLYYDMKVLYSIQKQQQTSIVDTEENLSYKKLGKNRINPVNKTKAKSSIEHKDSMLSMVQNNKSTEEKLNQLKNNKRKKDSSNEKSGGFIKFRDLNPRSTSAKHNNNDNMLKTNKVLVKKGSSQLEQDYLNKKEEYKKYFKESSPIRLACPYIDERNLKKIYEEKNKKRWIDKKGFNIITYTHDKEKAYIPNYVNVTPSINPNTFKFRVAEKDKWLNKKGFELFKLNNHS